MATKAKVVKIKIPASCVINKSHGKCQFYDRNGNIASLPNKGVTVFTDTDETGAELAWAHPEAGDHNEVPVTAVDPEGAEEIEQTLDEGGDPGEQGDAVLDALDRANAEEATDSGESEEQAATAPAAKKPSKRGSGKEKVMASAKAKAAAPKKAAVKKAGKVTVVAKQSKPGNGALVRSIKGRKHDISGYTKVKNAAGHTSYDNGDDTAEALRGLTLDAVFERAAKALKTDVKALKKQYGHLNPGMQRMSLGNRLRKVSREKAAAKAA